jgi:Pput_2613-like deaminase
MVGGFALVHDEGQSPESRGRHSGWVAQSPDPLVSAVRALGTSAGNAATVRMLRRHRLLAREPAVDYSGKTIPELKVLAKKDPDAVWELRGRYQNMTLDELRRAGRSDALARQVAAERRALALTAVPGDPRWEGHQLPHEATAISRDAQGNVVWQGEAISGHMTDAEKAMPFPHGMNASHTEVRLVLAGELPRGGTFRITGQYDPCTSCQTAMQAAANRSGCTIEYWWPGAPNGQPFVAQPQAIPPPTTPPPAVPVTTPSGESAVGATPPPGESGLVTGGELPSGSVFATHQPSILETDPRIVTAAPQHPAPHAPQPPSAAVPPSAVGGTPTPGESGSVTGGEVPSGSVFATHQPSILETDPRIVAVAPQQPAPHAPQRPSAPIAAEHGATGPSGASEGPVPAARPAASGEPEPGPILTPAGPSFGSQVASSAAVGGLALGAMMLQGWVNAKLGKKYLDLALEEARPLLDALVRAQSLSVEAMRARSPHHTVYARVHVWETTMYQGNTGPNGVMIYFPSPPDFTIAPYVSFAESVPQESEVWHPMHQTGFGWYTDVREYNLWFEVNSPAATP